MMTRARTAALYVCGHATDVDDARLLLDALGLVVDGGAGMARPRNARRAQHPQHRHQPRAGGAEMIGSVCGVFGPNGARCEVRFGHIAQHAVTDSKGVWRQW